MVRISDLPEAPRFHGSAQIEGVKVAAWVPMTSDLIRDCQTWAARHYSPWLFPDRNPMPTIDLWPRVRVGAERLRDAWAVLLGRETIYDEGDDW